MTACLHLSEGERVAYLARRCDRQRRDRLHSEGAASAGVQGRCEGVRLFVQSGVEVAQPGIPSKARQGPRHTSRACEHAR